MTYGVDYRDLARKLAGYVDRILKGAKPSELPVEQATKFDMVVNLKTANMLKPTLPQSILLRANSQRSLPFQGSARAGLRDWPRLASGDACGRPWAAASRPPVVNRPGI